MRDAVIVLCTCGDFGEAARLARALIEGQLAACVNILPGITSIYRWQGKIEEATEVLLIAKTARERFPSLRDRIVELHSYDTPEIIAVPIAEGSEKYLQWLDDQISA
jgi:periplasmic divalent cation tolerance protein